MDLLRACGLRVQGALPFEDRTLQVAFVQWLSRAPYFGIEYYSSVFDGAIDRRPTCRPSRRRAELLRRR